FVAVASQRLPDARVVVACSMVLSVLLLSATLLRLPWTLLYLVVWVGGQITGAGLPFGDEPQWSDHAFHLLAFAGSLAIAVWGVSLARRIRGVCVRCGRLDAAPGTPADRRTALRWLGVGAIAASLPYATLKTLWGLGVGIGVANGTFRDVSFDTPGFGDTVLLTALSAIVCLGMARPVRNLATRVMLATIAAIGVSMLVPVGVAGTTVVAFRLLGVELVSVSTAFADWVGLVYVVFLAWGLLLAAQTRLYWGQTRPVCRRHRVPVGIGSRREQVRHQQPVRTVDAH